MSSAGREERPVIVALDAHGADLGFAEVIAGANRALAAGIALRIFGPESEIRPLLRDAEGLAEIVDAPVAVSNHDDPATAVRSKRDASIVLAAKSVAHGETDALVSAGPTGATLAASLLNMKRIRGVKRPAIAALVPNGRGGSTVLLDAGANIDVPADYLVQFAVLGAEFARWVLGQERPKVGILSIGEESGKGTERVVEAGRLLSEGSHRFEFVGNVEGRDIPTDLVDVVVTDGFTGNVALKTLEGAAKGVMIAIRDAIKSSRLATLGGLLARRQLMRLRTEIDPNTTGGAPLLGVRGVAIVAHGSSTAEGIAAALMLAARSVEGGLVAHMTEAIDELRAAADEPQPVSETVVSVGDTDDA